MPDREEVLREMLESGLKSLKEKFGEDFNPEAVLTTVPLLLEVVWPYIESYNERHSIRTFEEMFSRRFPDHELVNYGTTVFEYICGNIQTAVANEIIVLLESWGQTMDDAQGMKKFQESTEPRDWVVAQSHLKELISEVRQYIARGTGGLTSAHTGSIPTLITPDEDEE
jgi:hypothetical protein